MDANLVGSAGFQVALQQARDRVVPAASRYFSSTRQWVMASRPLARMAIFSRADGWRSIGLSIVPLGSRGAPQTKAR